VKGWGVAIAGLLMVAGCGKPEPTPEERGRQQQQAVEEAQARRRAYDESRARAALAGPAQPSTDDIKHDLLDRYGMELTPFQRSALLAAHLSSREEGERMCEGWIAENRRMDAGSRSGGH
jgi:hypothetical protein